ncbi:MAG: hypothetical protein GKC10_08635 [Methanosarcinales archaeon]|nr:hypothetical protein [Methanosarcinales archaeon]
MELRLVAHCLLNPCSRVRGLEAPGPRPEGPLIQIPCPEALYLGLDRWAVTRNQLDLPEYRRFCRRILEHCLDMAEMHSRQGFPIVIVGVAKSPSCGVCSTTEGYRGGLVREQEHRHVPGRGVFMEELERELSRRGVPAEWQEAGDV